MLKEIAKQGTPQQQEWALRTIMITSEMRGQRETITDVYRALALPETPVKSRNVYDAENGFGLPGKLVRTEGDPPVSDQAVNEAFDGAGITYDFYSLIYNRNSLDDKGMRLDSTVHYQRSYDNAFWNGKQMVYGDGDEDLPPEQRLFNRFTASLDVIGHELSHGVISFEGNMNYASQSGALNESMADVFGILTKQYHHHLNVGESDWIIGRGLFTTNVNGVGIRSMKEPGSAYDDPTLGKDPQPGHMRDYVNTLEDNGGVHINSGIPNRAFYLTAVELGSFAWEKAGRIWYIALRDKFRTTTNFQSGADLLFQTAAEIYGANSVEQQAVKKGWEGVGIIVNAGPGSTSPGCLPGLAKIFGPRPAPSG